MKIEINPDNKQVYLSNLTRLKELLSTEDKRVWYDVFVKEHLEKLHERIYKLTKPRKITLTQAEQILVTVSFSINGDQTSKLVLHSIGSAIHPLIEKYAGNYLHSLILRNLK